MKTLRSCAVGLAATSLLVGWFTACSSSSGGHQAASGGSSGAAGSDAATGGSGGADADAGGGGNAGSTGDASDSTAPSDAPAETGSGIIDVSGTWDAVDVAGSLAASGVTCDKTSFVMTETATQLEIAQRVFSCTYTGNQLPAAVTFPDVTFTISGNQLLANGQSAGTIDATSVHVNQCVSGACTVITLTQTKPNRLDYAESASVSGTTQSSLTGKLFKQGTYTPGQLAVQPASVDFGTLAPGATPTQTLTVTNTGGELAENIAASGLTSPVSFAGGSYPGTAGTCGASLAAGKSCKIVIQAGQQPSFTATSFSASLALDYSSVGTAYTTNVAIQGTEPVIQVANVFTGPTFGTSVAADGTLALAGAPECGPVGPNPGCVEAFVDQNGTWKGVQRITGGSQYFGVGVALSGTQALIETNGTVAPYAWNGTQWVAATQAPLSVPLGATADSTDTMWLRMSGNAAVVSSGDNSALAILAYDGTNWSVAATPSGTWGPSAVSGNWIAAGQSAGVHMFHLSGGVWSDVQTLNATSTSSLALDGTTLAVGTPSAVELYTYDGTSWQPGQTLADPTGQSGVDYFATSSTLALRGGHLFVGAPGYTIYVLGFIMQGEVFESTLSGTTWSSWTGFTENTTTNLKLGGAVALSGSFALATDSLKGQVAFIAY